MRPHRAIAGLLFGSGLCALIYQVAWLRELRLVFGASTPASAAVLAVFMAGLGYGSLVLSKRAQASPRPLLLYAKLELGIALSAAASPLLLVMVRAGYIAAGGAIAAGPVLGTAMRLLLSALVLLPPTMLMGGTLPAAARAATPRSDVARRATALLYGANTLGAVLGAAASTFVLLEVFGTWLTLWLGCVLNALVAVLAWMLDRRLQEAPRPSAAQAEADDSPAAAPSERARSKPRRPLPHASTGKRFVLFAAAAVGFVFFLMELCWYRMLAPLLGGSTYTFGLILTVALLGIGLGGGAYTLRGALHVATLRGFAWTCGLEAALLAIPYALGDRLAVLALLLRVFRIYGLFGHALAWGIVTAIVVLPAAIVAGYQFPLLISLLGKGDEQVGRQVGLAYAANTLGAIAGSLAGGFVLLPPLGALGTWQLTTWLLALLAIAALLLGHQRSRARWRSLHRSGAPALVAALSLLALHGSRGPTAAWRHSPIGAGRSDGLLQQPTRNALQRWLHEQRHAVTWQVDGRESCIGLHTLNDTAFVINGKSDGAAVEDSSTQIMSGLLGAMLHPQVERALVIGLGTGSTAGWLAEIDTVEAVDVVEIEPAIVEVARACAPVNHDVLDNPKVRLILGDAREVLLTSRDRYDLVFSEPSNPYRAGIASLFTQEFYQAVQERLEPGGLFVQWVQGYEIDTQSIRTVYTTLSSVFPTVETWRTDRSDLMLFARAEPLGVDVDRLRQRVRQEPFRSGLLAAWRATRAEDVLARYVAQPTLAAAIAESAGPLLVNSDDRNLLEFAVARALGRPQRFEIRALLDLAERRQEHRPTLIEPARAEDAIDWERVLDAYTDITMVSTAAPSPLPPRDDDEEREVRYQAALAWTHNNPVAAVRAWSSQSKAAERPVELMMLADSYAALGDEQAALPLIASLREQSPTEASAVTARLRYVQDRTEPALAALREALLAYREDPWPNKLLMARTVLIAEALAHHDRRLIPELVELLGAPLSMHALRYQLEQLRFRIALLGDDPQLCVTALGALEPNVPWEREFLLKRLACYGRAEHGLEQQARQDLALFELRQGSPGTDLLL